MENEMENKLKENRQKIKELGAEIDVYNMKPISRKALAEIQEIKDRLQFQLMDLEEKGQEVKIKTMKKVLSILKK